jgi:hypothetical protein
MGRHHHNNLSALCQACLKKNLHFIGKLFGCAWGLEPGAAARSPRFLPRIFFRRHLRRHFHLRRRSEELELVAKFSTAALATSRIFTPHASSPRHEETPQPFG